MKPSLRHGASRNVVFFSHNFHEPPSLHLQLYSINFQFQSSFYPISGKGISIKDFLAAFTNTTCIHLYIKAIIPIPFLPKNTNWWFTHFFSNISEQKIVGIPSLRRMREHSQRLEKNLLISIHQGKDRRLLEAHDPCLPDPGCWPWPWHGSFNLEEVNLFPFNFVEGIYSFLNEHGSGKSMRT